MDNDDSRCIDRHAKRTLSRATQFDTRIKDLDVSQTSLSPLVPHLILFQSKLREHLGNFRAIESSIKGALAELNVCTDASISRSSNTFPPKNAHREMYSGQTKL